MIQVFVEQESIAQEGKAGDADSGRGEDMRLLRDGILRPVVLSHGKTRNIGSDRRKRIRRGAGAEHVAKIQSVGTGKIMIQAHSELVIILDKSLRGVDPILSLIRQREKR